MGTRHGLAVVHASRTHCFGFGFVLAVTSSLEQRGLHPLVLASFAAVHSGAAAPFFTNLPCAHPHACWCSGSAGSAKYASKSCFFYINAAIRLEVRKLRKCADHASACGSLRAPGIVFIVATHISGTIIVTIINNYLELFGFA